LAASEAPALVVENLDLYYGDAQALAGVSLEVSRGATVAIVGANGAGKSSADPHHRRPREAARRPHPVSMAARSSPSSHTRSAISALVRSAEGRQVFSSMTVLENLEMGAHAAPRPPPASAAGSTRSTASSPGCASARGQLARHPSGGEQQMGAMAAASWATPSSSCSTSPSLGLAPIVVREVMRTIQHLGQRGTTILLVEQKRRRLAQDLAARLRARDPGRIVLTGTGEEVLASERVRQAYLGL